MSNEAGYHVRTALGWLEVGAPDGAKESLSKALTLVDDEATKGLISDAMRLCSSANPRAADAAVKKIIAHERAQKVAALKKVNRLVELRPMRIDVRSDGATCICHGWRDALGAARSFRRRGIDFTTNAHRCVGTARD